MASCQVANGKFTFNMSRTAYTRTRRWCFTINNPTEDCINDYRNRTTGFRYLVAELEHLEEGTPHIQGYVEFDKQKRLQEAKKWVGYNAHLEQAMGTKMDNIKYCTKEARENPEQLLAGSLEDCKEPEKSSGRKARMDEEAKNILTDIGELTEIEMMEQHPHFYLYHADTFRKHRHQFLARHTKTVDGELQNKNLWIYGPAGTGKSRLARSGEMDVCEMYDKPVNKWWDGFDPDIHRRVIIDDYPSISGGGNCLVQHMKRWADRYSFTGEIKGASRFIIPSFQLVVTSNFKIEECFQNEEDVKAIKRRFQEIEWGEDHPEGSLEQFLTLDGPEE